ncbi:MAG: methionine gamma-lyase family protein [Clostridia bacterium]|nr:methionine gamma-lyase family protein [Clostridia bacterium]
MPERGNSSMNIEQKIAQAEVQLQDTFRRIDEIELLNTQKILSAFREERISYRHFAPSTGYGYDDIGRDTLARIYAAVFGTESALVRPQIASGTHALALAMQGVLRPGDVLLCASGRPYDTLEEVIGLSGEPGHGSLMEYGVEYRECPLTEDGEIDLEKVVSMIDERVRLVHIQRSRGYAWRPALTVDQINRAIDAVHAASDRAVVMVDNCYGEFCQTEEPRADLLAGSLIKNPGGGIAPTGGYIAGRSDLVDLVAYRMTSPGIGAEVGSYAASYQPFYQGLFLAPHVTAQAIKTSALAAKLFSDMGYAVEPAYDAQRNDIIQAIRFEDSDKLIAFVRAIQAVSPVDSNVVPEAWSMPGYQDPVIMAAGTFVAGASIELSADAPIRPPYVGYLQGGLTYAHGKIAMQLAAQEMEKL